MNALHVVEHSPSTVYAALFTVSSPSLAFQTAFTPPSRSYLTDLTPVTAASLDLDRLLFT